MTGNILLVDDDTDFADMTSATLEAQGYQVQVANNPIIGWKKMEQYQPDIILVDWGMPEMSGIEFVKLVKGHITHHDRYIIMVTGRIGTENIVQGLDAGADDYLIKPFHMEELLARVRSGLRIRSLEKCIAEETKKMTVFEMALSVADKIGNPIAAAKLYHKMLMQNSKLAQRANALDSLKALGQLIDEALQLINKFQSIEVPRSIPAPGGKTMIAPE